MWEQVIMRESGTKTLTRHHAQSTHKRSWYWSTSTGQHGHNGLNLRSVGEVSVGEPVRKQLHPVLMRPPPEIRRHAAMRMHEVGEGGIALCRQINWTSLAIYFTE